MGFSRPVDRAALTVIGKTLVQLPCMLSVIIHKDGRPPVDVVSFCFSFFFIALVFRSHYKSLYRCSLSKCSTSSPSI
jgi:hypothetical protein